MTNHLVAISGSQSAGKSTTIKQLGIKHGYANDAISIPRFVQKQLGYSSLAEVLSQPIETIKNYQLQILEAKFKRDLTNKNIPDTNGVVIVERSFADIYSFAKQWALESASAEFVSWVDHEYKDKCLEYQNEIGYLSVLLCPLDSFEVDPRRASEASRFLVHARMTKFLDLAIPNSYLMLMDKSIDGRVAYIHSEIQGRVFNK